MSWFNGGFFDSRIPDGGVFYSGCKLHGTSIVLDDDDLDDVDDDTAARAAFVLVSLAFFNSWEHSGQVV